MEQRPDSWAVSGRPSAASAECADSPDSSPGGGPSSAASADPAPPGISPPPPAAAAALDPDPTVPFADGRN
ncbi:MAG: hypothetical protein QOK17_3011 [Sphingomonadales bacterium]|jgi:hypothetical protein|nr:hypothetical protein [Sphingomonadales bacterium]